MFEDEEELVTDDRPCQITDTGLRVASQTFISIEITKLTINECPYLRQPSLWVPQTGRNLVHFIKAFQT